MNLPEAVIEIELDPSEASDMELGASEGSDNAISDEEFIIEFDPELEREDVLHPQIPMSNYDNDRELQEDVECGWKQLLLDNEDAIAPIPFMGVSQLNMTHQGRQPEHFFDELFDTRMWEQIAQSTNEYAHKKITQLGADPLQRMEHPNYAPHARTNYWRDVSADQLKVFVAHLIVMGIIRKADLESYWQKSGVGQTPFFGKYMTRNRFTAILSNLHLVDDSNNPAFGQRGHDPLAKLRPFITMCEDNFRFVYKPQKNLSMDESACPFKGRLRFRCYNPRKPARFHIKIFQICESASGYISGFSVYTGKGSCIEPGVTLNPDCGATMKTVMTLAEKCSVLDKGHCLYMDNYYTSPELHQELLYRDTLACGTVRSNRKGLPSAVISAKLKEKGDTCWRRSMDGDDLGPLLALKWHDKRDVTMLCTMHGAHEKWSGRNDRTAQQLPIYKPTCIVEYIKHMGGVDLSDQLLTYYSFLRWSCKWWRKLFVHLLNMIILNAHILNKKYGAVKLGHVEYREKLAEYLVCSANGLQRLPSVFPGSPLPIDRLVGVHFPVKLCPTNGKVVPLLCKVCSVNRNKSAKLGIPERRKSSSYKCQQCNVVMCIDPCFRTFHTLQ